MIAGAAGIGGIHGPWYNAIPSTAQHKDAARQFIADAIAHNAMGIEAPLRLAATNSACQSYLGVPGDENFQPLMATLRCPRPTTGRSIPTIGNWSAKLSCPRFIVPSSARTTLRTGSSKRLPWCVTSTTLAAPIATLFSKFGDDNRGPQ